MKPSLRHLRFIPLHAALVLATAAPPLGANEVFVPFEKAANMGFADDVKFDGKGGWHDHGPDQDARYFPVHQKEFHGVPFRIVDPGTNGGKSILVFRGWHFLQGLREASIPLAAPAPAKYLYLLHATAWGVAEDKTVATILLADTAGKTAEIKVIPATDGADWFMPKEKDNAVIGAFFELEAGNGAAFVSKYKVPAELGPIAKVSFNKASGTIWILCAATLSDTDYAFTKETLYEVVENDIWRPMPVLKAEGKPGTALDFSVLFPARSADDLGRVVSDGKGGVKYEKTGETARFMIATGFLDDTLYKMTRVEIDAQLYEMRKAGYNAWRCWSGGLFRADAAEQAKAIDNLFYIVSRFRKTGCYLHLSLVNGYEIYADPDQRVDWFTRASSLLAPTNPYTGVPLAQDPVLAFIDLNNELEFALPRTKSADFAPAFRKFLKAKYKDNLGALCYEWKVGGIQSFDDIAFVHPQQDGPVSKDYMAFFAHLAEEVSRTESQHLRALGYNGLISNFLTSPAVHYSALRNQLFDFLARNVYFQHPPTWGSNIQASSIFLGVPHLRTVFGSCLYGKPTVITEHGYSFWQKNRREQAFVDGGYGALHGFSGLTAFRSPLAEPADAFIRIFYMGNDPVLRSADYLTCLLLRRGDVRTADGLVRLTADAADDRVRPLGESPDIDPMRLGFLCRMATDYASAPAAKNEYTMPRQGLAQTQTSIGDTRTASSGRGSFDMAGALADMKKRGLVPAANRTDPALGRYESATGELFLDCRARAMTIDTPRFQGLCAPAGSTARLANLDVVAAGRDASIALASIDAKAAPLSTANRMLLVIATDALNSHMMFENRYRNSLKSGKWPANQGRVPVLLETGAFSLRLRGTQAAGMKLFALRVDGTRSEEIPFRMEGDGVLVHIDTATLKEPTVYFELAQP